MVSPSGIAVRAVIFVVSGLTPAGGGINRRRNSAHLISGRRQDESALFQKASDEVAGGGLLVDGCNQQPAPALLKSDRDLGQFLRQVARDLASFRFLFGKKYANGRISPAVQCSERARYQVHACCPR